MRDGMAELVSRDQTLRRERGQRNINFQQCLTDYEQDWQPYPLVLYSAICNNDHTCIHTIKYCCTWYRYDVHNRVHTGKVTVRLINVVPGRRLFLKYLASYKLGRPRDTYMKR